MSHDLRLGAELDVVCEPLEEEEEGIERMKRIKLLRKRSNSFILKVEKLNFARREIEETLALAGLLWF